MEVGGNNKTYPGRNLSNFFPHPFIFRGFEVSSMEGFLQGLKFKSPEMQAEVFKLVGLAAKKKVPLKIGNKPKRYGSRVTQYLADPKLINSFLTRHMMPCTNKIVHFARHWRMFL